MKMEKTLKMIVMKVMIMMKLNEKLRAYELSRLRYYFTMVICDSVATADYLYKSWDGIEFERSSHKLDLRFVPNLMEFKHPDVVMMDFRSGMDPMLVYQTTPKEAKKDMPKGFILKLRYVKKLTVEIYVLG